MRRHKKLIVTAVLAGVLLFASLGVVALATDSGDGGLKAKYGDFIDKVIANYESETGDTLNREALEAAITDAKTQMKEEAMENRPQGLTDEQKEALKEWCESKPRLTDEQKEALKEWRDSRPEDLPLKFGGRKHGIFFRGMCKPPAPSE
ncbi:hypothetical protein ACFLUS_05595 [Chloroflexota bacterium]